MNCIAFMMYDIRILYYKKAYLWARRNPQVSESDDELAQSTNPNAVLPIRIRKLSNGDTQYLDTDGNILSITVDETERPKKKAKIASDTERMAKDESTGAANEPASSSDQSEPLNIQIQNMNIDADLK